MAKKLCASHVSVSSFHFSTGNYVDLASQSILPRHTGGQLYLYANCVPEQRDEWCAKLQAELARNLMRSYGYEGVNESSIDGIISMFWTRSKVEAGADANLWQEL